MGDDITSEPALRPRRWIINFGEMSLEQAMGWSAALAIVRKRVKPGRDRHRRARERLHWWRFSRTAEALFKAVVPLGRFIACPATAKRFHMIWCDTSWVPSNAASVFAFDDDFSMGVLLSAVHTRWATAQSTRLETRPRYTVASFATFPWPYPITDAQGEAVAAASRALILRRSEICLERQIGLTKLYNQMDDGAWADLRKLHREVDEAVAAAYGWPKRIAQDPAETNARLLELNRAIASGERPYDPFGSGAAG